MSYTMGERVVGFVEHIFSYGKRLSAMDACVALSSVRETGSCAWSVTLRDAGLGKVDMENRM